MTQYFKPYKAHGDYVYRENKQIKHNHDLSKCLAEMHEFEFGGDDTHTIGHLSDTTTPSKLNECWKIFNTAKDEDEDLKCDDTADCLWSDDSSLVLEREGHTHALTLYAIDANNGKFIIIKEFKKDKYVEGCMKGIESKTVYECPNAQYKKRNEYLSECILKDDALGDISPNCPHFEKSMVTENAVTLLHVFHNEHHQHVSFKIAKRGHEDNPEFQSFVNKEIKIINKEKDDCFAECHKHFSEKDEYQCTHGQFEDKDGKIECKDIAIPKECHNFIKLVVSEDNPNYEHYLVTLIKRKRHRYFEFLIKHKHHHRDDSSLIFETYFHKNLKITKGPNDEVHNNEHHKKNCFHHFTESNDGKYKCPHDKFEDKGGKIECKDIEIPDACKEFVHSVVKSEHYDDYSISLVGSNKHKKFELMIKHGNDEAHPKEHINGLKEIISVGLAEHAGHKTECFDHLSKDGQYDCQHGTHHGEFVEHGDKIECKDIEIPTDCHKFVHSVVKSEHYDHYSISLVGSKKDEKFELTIKHIHHPDKQWDEGEIPKLKKVIKHHAHDGGHSGGHTDAAAHPNPEHDHKEECYAYLSSGGTYNCHHEHELADGKKICHHIETHKCKKFVESKEECKKDIDDCSITLIEEGDGHCMFKIMKRGQDLHVFKERIPEKLKIVHITKKDCFDHFTKHHGEHGKYKCQHEHFNPNWHHKRECHHIKIPDKCHELVKHFAGSKFENYDDYTISLVEIKHKKFELRIMKKKPHEIEHKFPIDELNDIYSVKPKDADDDDHHGHHPREPEEEHHTKGEDEGESKEEPKGKNRHHFSHSHPQTKITEPEFVLDGSMPRRQYRHEPEEPKEELREEPAEHDKYRHVPEEPEDEPTPKAEHDNPPNVKRDRKNNAQGSDSRSISCLYVLITFLLLFPMNLFVRF